MLTKILIATAENGKVSVESGKVPEANILSAGKAKSNGILMISEEQKFYIALPMESITQILELLNDALSKINMASLGVPTQGWASPPTLPTDLAAVIQQISQLKDNLQ